MKAISSNPLTNIKAESTKHVHFDRTEWIPDFTDPDTERPDPKELSKVQLKHLNKLYSMQFKRSFDTLFPEEGYLTTTINECASILHQEREPEAEIEQEHLDEHLK